MHDPTPATASTPETAPDEWFRVLFESAPTAMAVMNPRLRFHVVNGALCRMFGRSAAELRQLGMVDVTHPDDLERSFQAARAARGGAPARMEKRYVRPDGTFVWGQVSATRWVGPDGAIWVLVSIQDITARMEAEVLLGARAAELGSLFEEAPFGMAVNAPDGRFLRVNRALCDLVGYSAGELRSMAWLDIVHPLDRDETAANQDRERAGADWERDVVRRIVTRDGRVAWLRCKGQVVRGDDGEVRYSVGQFVDLTPAREHEEERRLLEEHLRRSQRTETIGRVAGGLVHDFNNMLSVILNLAELARRRPPAGGPVGPGDRDYVEQIYSAATRAAALSRRLMSFGRTDPGVPELLDVNAVVTEIRHLLQRVAGEDVRFSTELAPGLPPVRVVRPHLEQALFNLVVNARDAMPVGGRLTVRTRAAPPSADTPGEMVCIEVEDTGTGVPEDVVPHLFEPFFTTKEPGHGTGLGLSIVQHVVSEAGGHVGVETRPGGTTFSLRLPAAVRGDDTAGAPASPGLAPGRGERVLVVEDEPTLLELAVELLAGNGYVPLPAPGGEPALELARSMKGRIDLLLTDLVMPGMSGAQLAAALRATHPEMRVLLMSGHPDERVARHAPDGTRLNILRKPFSPHDMLEAVRRTLDAPGES